MTPHPWRWLRRLSHVHVVHVPLPEGVRGFSHRDTIWLDSRQLQAERRCTLTHELIHLTLGHHGPQPERVERVVDELAARYLVQLEDLIEAARWTRHLGELADELGVDVDTARARIEGLDEGERAAVLEAVERLEVAA